MKKYLIFFSLILIILLSNMVIAGLWTVNGWDWIEEEGKISLWQKKDPNYISEAVVSMSVPLNCELLRGYTVKLNEKERFSASQCDDYPVGIWKIIYTGFDSSGNIYLKIFREEDNIKDSEISKIKEEIIKLTNSEETTDGEIKDRINLFNTALGRYLKDEGEITIIDPSRTIVINSLDDIPPLELKLGEKNSVLCVSVKKLE